MSNEVNAHGGMEQVIVARQNYLACDRAVPFLKALNCS
jgi:hypothetical protein